MKILLLGASGNIGEQTLDVIKHNPTDFELVGISVGQRTRCITSIIKNNPSIKHICIKQKSSYNYYKGKYPNISFYHGNEGLLELIRQCEAEMVINALVGFVGLSPSIESLKHNKILELANKDIKRAITTYKYKQTSRNEKYSI